MASENSSSSTRAEWWRADTATLHARKQELEVLKRQAELNTRGIRGYSGHSTLKALIGQDFHLSDKEAGDRADRVLALGFGTPHHRSRR